MRWVLIHVPVIHAFIMVHALWAMENLLANMEDYILVGDASFVMLHK